MTIWIIPVITLIYNGIARLVNMGADTENLFMALIYYGTGLMFMVIGNYLPKVKTEQYDRNQGRMDIAG